MNLHSEKTLRFTRNALNSHIMAEAVKSGTKKTAATAVIAQRVGVDRKSLKDFVEGDVAKPSSRVMQKYVDWLGANPEKGEKPLLVPKEVTTAPLSNDEIAILLDLLGTTALTIRDDSQRLEAQTGDYEVSQSTQKALYLQEGRLNRLSKKLESLASCKFDFDVELQTVVPLN